MSEADLPKTITEGHSAVVAVSLLLHSFFSWGDTHHVAESVVVILSVKACDMAWVVLLEASEGSRHSG